jgi:WD40 repeat protein
MFVSADGETLVSTDGQQLFHWNAATGQLIKAEPLAIGNRTYQQSRLATNGSRGLFVRDSSNLDVISLASPSTATSISVHAAPHHGIAISANGKRIAVADAAKKNVVVWDIENHRLIDEWQIDSLSAQTVAVSADGKYVLTGGHHQVLQLWEMTE